MKKGVLVTLGVVALLALMVWAYALVSFMVGSMIKIGTYRLLEYRAEHQVRHLTRVESHVAVPKQAAAPNITKG